MAEMIAGLFAAVAAVCALFAIAAVRKTNRMGRELTDAVRAIAAERTRITAHESEIEQLAATLRKLSGRIGAIRKQNREPDSYETPGGDVASYKAQLRARVGLVPGRPAPKL